MRIKLGNSLDFSRVEVVSISLLLLSSLLAMGRSAAGQALVKPSSTNHENVSMVSHKGLYFQECGASSQAVVLLHDGVVDSSVWDGVWESFCSQFHTIRYDRRGYGRSAPAPSPYDETGDLVDLLTERNVTAASIVGASHGTAIAIDFALRYPNRLKELVLVGPVLSGFSYSSLFSERAIKTFGAVNGESAADRIKRVLDDPYLIDHGNEIARRSLARLLTASPQDLTHSDPRIELASAVGRLVSIHVPTFVITGASDIPDVQAHAGAIQAGIANAKRIILPNCAHLLYLEKPEEFSQMVSDFLRGTQSILPGNRYSDADLQSLHDKDVAATLSGDPVGLANLFTEDAVLFEPGQPPQRSRAVILAENIREKQRNPLSREVSYNVDIRDIRVEGESAVEWGTFQASFQEKPESTVINVRGSVLRVLRHQPGGAWLFSLVMWTPFQ